jgi:hypothetical protein
MSRTSRGVGQDVGVAFWLAIVGGLLLVAAEVLGSSATALVGAVLFLAGVAWFSVSATRTARRSGVGFGRAVAQSVKKALRFALELMP